MVNRAVSIPSSFCFSAFNSAAGWLAQGTHSSLAPHRKHISNEEGLTLHSQSLPLTTRFCFIYACAAYPRRNDLQMETRHFQREALRNEVLCAVLALCREAKRTAWTCSQSGLYGVACALHASRRGTVWVGVVNYAPYGSSKYNNAMRRIVWQAFTTKRS